MKDTRDIKEGHKGRTQRKATKEGKEGRTHRKETKEGHITKKGGGRKEKKDGRKGRK